MEESRMILAAFEGALSERLLAMAEKGRVLKENEARRRSGPFLRIYAGTVAAVIVFLMAAFSWQLIRSTYSVSFHFAENVDRPGMVSPVSLEYVRVEGQPADTYIYRTTDPEMIIIWAVKD